MKENCILVGKPKSSVSNGFFYLSATISGVVEGECFYSLPVEYRDWVDEDSSNCFMIGLLYTAMYAGCDLRLEGCVSEKLLFHTREYLLPMLRDFFDGSLSKISIEAARTTDVFYQDADVVGAAFSGGVDSFYTILKRTFGEHTPPAYRVNTLFFFNVGSHGMGTESNNMTRIEEKFQARWEALKQYPQEINLPYIQLNSNVHKFHQSGHLQTSTLATFSAALFMGRKVKLYYLGSAGFNYENLYKISDSQDYDIELIDDYLLPHICTETFNAISDGSEDSRTEKTRFIVSYEPVRRFLNVCGSQEAWVKNCSLCYKCNRTMMTLDILKVLDQFDLVFDKQPFLQKGRKRLIAEILNKRKKDLFFKDIYEFAESEHYDLRGKTSLFTRLYMMFSDTRLCMKLRQIKKRFLK